MTKPFKFVSSRVCYEDMEITVHANSEEEAMKKFNAEDYDEANVTEPHSMQGEDDDFEEIVCVSDYCEKEE